MARTANFGWRIGTGWPGTSHAGCGDCRILHDRAATTCATTSADEPRHRQYGHYIGADAEYVVHSVRSVFTVPDELSVEEAR